MKVILFDIDGTLLWTHGAGRRAVMRALESEMGVAGVDRGYRFDGKTDLLIIRELLSRAGHPDAAELERVRAVCDTYVRLLPDELHGTEAAATVLPGVDPLLDALERSPAVTLGLLTGNVAGGARLKLSAAGLAFDRFRVTAFGSDSDHRPDLAHLALKRAREMGLAETGSDLVVVGDTPADVECGKEVGATTVGVATGFYTAEALRDAGADHWVDTLEDTEHLVNVMVS